MFKMIVLDKNNEKISTGTDHLSYGFRVVCPETDQPLHSLRVGSAVSLAKAGASVVDLQVAGRLEEFTNSSALCSRRDGRTWSIARYKETDRYS